MTQLIAGRKYAVSLCISTSLSLLDFSDFKVLYYKKFWLFFITCPSSETVLSANKLFFFVVTDYGAQFIVRGGSVSFHFLTTASFAYFYYLLYTDFDICSYQPHYIFPKDPSSFPHFRRFHQLFNFFNGSTQWAQASLLRFRDHIQTHHTRLDSSGRVIGPWQRPLPDNTRYSQATNIHASCRIRTRNPSKLAAVDPRLRPWCQCHRRLVA